VNASTVALSPSHIPIPAGGSYPARAGNRLRLLIDGENAFRRIAEAVEAARHSVWLSVNFLLPDFRLPDGRGELFDLLDRATARGIDVRVLFWRPSPDSPGFNESFGKPEHRRMLAARNSTILIRWDAVPGIYCQHQKFWIVDAGSETETAFVGGINLAAHSVVPQGHRGDGQFHDLYSEVTGPSATDVHHNFVQRWNGASERGKPDGTWGAPNDDVPLPARISPVRGDSLVQIQREMPAGVYGLAAPERTILEQYVAAIDAAQHTIYLENQGLAIEPVLARLDAALMRGVDVVYLTPGNPYPYLRAQRRHPDHKVQFERLAGLARHPHFALTGIAGLGTKGRSDVYVHAKAMIVDDVWATLGSCNLHAFSLFGHTELNASFWDPHAARGFRVALLAEHLGTDTTDLDDRAALALYRHVAKENRAKRDRGDPDWQGIAYALDPVTYGE